MTDEVAAIVLAGGQGTRLFPLTQSRCKPAVSFGGRYCLVDIPISNALNSDIREIYVIAQYFASDLNAHIAATYQADLKYLCPEETTGKKVWFQGTADAVRQNCDHLAKSSARYFLILSGDQLYNIDFRTILSFAKKKDADLVIASLLVDEPEAKRMGIMKMDAEGRILDFVEKPKEKAVLDRLRSPENKYVGSMGIYVFKREALFHLLQQEGNDFGHHLIPCACKNGKTFCFLYDGYWEDIGTVASYYNASLALIEQNYCLNTYDEKNPIRQEPDFLPSPKIKNTRIVDALIGDGSLIEAEEISHSVIGVRCSIKKGTVIRDSIVLGNTSYKPSFSIGKNCLIQKAIIDQHTTIGNQVRLVNEKDLSTFDGDGIYIRDGIIIVTTGTELPDGFVL